MKYVIDGFGAFSYLDKKDESSWFVSMRLNLKIGSNQADWKNLIEFCLKDKGV